MKKAFLLALLAAAAMHAVPAAQQPIVAGPNVNIIGGPVKIVKTLDGKFQLLEGDPGQRQDEVGCFVDSRNSLDLGCAYNDYTPVEIAGLNGDGETGDAWIGYSVSIDGGSSWRKFMLPGYKQDVSPEGLASPLHVFDAASDPTWVSGPNGTSFLTAIAFNRAAGAGGLGAEPSNSVVFVQKFVNNNNVENDPQPFKARGRPRFFPRDDDDDADDPPGLGAGHIKRFQDKPWGGVAPNGDFNMVWSTFRTGPTGREHSTIWRLTCPGGNLDACARTRISLGDRLVNGAIVTFHPGTGWTDISYRRFAYMGQSGAIMFVRCLGPHLCTWPKVVAAPPNLVRSDGSVVGALFDQGAGNGIFRNVSNPAIAADTNRRVYVVWAQRIQETQGSLVTRDSKLMLSIGTTGPWGVITSFSPPVDVDWLTSNPLIGRGNRLRPSLWFGSGKLYLSAAVLQEDQTLGVFDLQTFDDPGKPGGKILKYVETRDPKGELYPAADATHLGRAFTEFIYDRAPADPTHNVAPVFDQPIARRHTEEIGLWTGIPAPAGSAAPPAFQFTKVWRPRIGFRTISRRYEQIEFNPWGIPTHCGGDCSFAGDYDINFSQQWVANASGTGFVPNTSPSNSTPVYVAWTDNRFIKSTDPHLYTPAGSGAACVPDFTGTRNQEIMLARAGEGLYVYTFGNQKPLGNATFEGIGTFQIKRGYAVNFQSAVNSTKHYRAVIANQPTGGSASWKQFEVVTQIDLSIPPFSTAARELYAKSTDPNATIRVNVFEITGPGLEGTEVPGGLKSFTIINPDRTTPNLMAPINPGTIDPTDPGKAEIFIPDPLSPDPLSANVIRDAPTPDPLSPDPLSPDPLSAGLVDVDPTSPDPLSPDPLSPDPLSPDPLSPDPLSVAPGGVMTDTLVEVRNASNTSAAIAVKTFATRPVPAGSRLQILVVKPYFTTTQKGCDLKTKNASQVVATISDPELVTDPGNLTFDPTNASTKNLTISALPGERFFLVYRFVDPVAADNFTFTDAVGRKHSIDPQFNPAVDLIPVPIAEAVSTPIAATCGTGDNPPCPTGGGTAVSPLRISTNSLAGAVKGGGAYLQALAAAGGTPPYSWSASGLPLGLSVQTIEGSGRINGVVSHDQVTGTFPVTLMVTDSAGRMASTVLPMTITELVFVSTFNGHQILKVDPMGSSTVIYDGSENSPTFKPEDIVFGPDNKLYVANSVGSEIWRMDPDGSNATPIYSFGGSGPIGPEGPSFLGNDLYFNTRGGTGFTPTGVWKIVDATITVPGAPVNVYSATDFGEGTTFDANGNLLSVDREAGTVLRLRLAQPIGESNPETVITGLPTPFGIAVNNAGDIFVAVNDTAGDGTRKVLRYSSTGGFISDYATFDDPDGPFFLEFDANGNLFVVTSQSNTGAGARVWRIDTEGVKTRLTPPLSDGGPTTLPFGVGLAVP